MSATGLDVFDRTVQTTNIWLEEIDSRIGPDRRVARHVLGAVLRTLRDRLPIGLAAHLGAQLPLLDPDQLAKVRDALSKPVRRLWPDSAAEPDEQTPERSLERTES